MNGLFFAFYINILHYCCGTRTKIARIPVVLWTSLRTVSFSSSVVFASESEVEIRIVQLSEDETYDIPILTYIL
jgi:phosphatidylglycerophosphatase A